VAGVHRIEPDRARAAMVASYQAVTGDAGQLGEAELARPSGCLGWSRADLLFHMLLDAQRALVTFATPADGERDVDFVSYWAPFRPAAEGYLRHARFTRRVASSFESDLDIVALWTETAAAAARAATALPDAIRVATQGHVLAAADFLATLAVEATIHHLDLTAGLTSLAGPSGPGLAVTRQTLDGVLGQPVPAGWDDATYALKATGRADLTDDDRASLGALAARLPLLG
jgi:Mycothiol maleylpyruvate isomerase N-terminal domain